MLSITNHIRNAFSAGKGLLVNSILQQACRLPTGTASILPTGTASILPTGTASILPVRCASKKAGSSKRHTGGKRRGKRLGVKKHTGEFVQVGMILVRQKGAYRWLPGQYVGTGRDRTLYAMESGYVFYTRERWIPAPVDGFTRDVAPTLPDERLMKTFTRDVAPTLPDERLMKTFIHINPEPQEGRFQLVEQV